MHLLANGLSLEIFLTCYPYQCQGCCGHGTESVLATDKIKIKITQGNSTVKAIISEYLLYVHVSLITTELILSCDVYKIFEICEA